MKTTTLSPHSSKKERYALKAFLWGAIIAALFIVPSIIIDKGKYLYAGDFNQQVIPFYQLMSSAIKNGEWGWSWYTDLGTAFVGGYSYYSLGSPFFWLMVPFPVDSIPYLMGPITILKIGLCSLNAYLFLKRYVKNKNNALIGSMLYAFSGFAISSMVFHFVDIFVFFPLLMLTMDMFIYENKRGRFAAMVAVCAIVNYYFFVAEAVFCLIYWIVRTATKSYRMPARNAVYLFLEAVLGAGIAMFILLPSLYHIVGNSRVSETDMTGWRYYVYESAYMYAQLLLCFFMPPEHPTGGVYLPDFDSAWKTMTAYLPLFSMAGVFAVMFNRRKYKWLRVFYIVCAVFMFVPVLNSSFQMFRDYSYVRWFFMLMLVMSLGSVAALENSSIKWKKPIITCLVLLSVITLVIGFTPVKNAGLGIMGDTAMFWIFVAVAFFNLALCAILVSLYKKNRTAFNRFGALITSFAIISTMMSVYIPLKVQSYDDLSIYKANLINGGDEIKIDDIQDWRTDVICLLDYSEQSYDKDNIESYDYPQLEEMAQISQNKAQYAEDSQVLDNENTTIYWRIPGMQSFHSTVNGSVMDFYAGLDFDRTTLSNISMGMYGLRTLCSVKYIANYSDSSFNVTDDNGDLIYPGWKYYDTQNGFDFYENEYVLPMGFTFDNFIIADSFKKIPTQYKHLALLNAMVVESFDDIYLCVGAGMGQADRNEFEFTEEEYIKNCQDRINNSCYDFKRDKKGFEAKIDIGEGRNNAEYELVFFSVPYDRGWKAYVNGEKADIYQVDFGFMAVKVPLNQTSSIRFDYHTPGILYGTFVSGVCLFILVIYLAAMKIQSTPDDEEQTDSDNENNKNNENNENKTTETNENEEEDISIFDIVKQTEEENMMHVYKRVPVVLESGSGSVAYDINYKKYIDFTSGIGVNALGFANSSWVDAVDKQLDLVQHTSNIYYNTTQIQLAELLCLKTGFSKVFFANSGAEANECAIKLARKYGSDKYGESHTHIVTLENSFHGRTITTLAATGQEAFHKYFMPFTEGFSYAKANDMTSIKSSVTDDTCAVMIELIQGEGGVNPLDAEFVKELAEFCKERDILLIVDEIQTGIGRTGKLFCYENYGIEPDVITSAKALGGGLPLSACLCNEKLSDVMTTGTNGTTFGGNVIACAGAMKIVDIVADDELLKDVRKKGKYMRQRIKSFDGVKEVRGMGLMIGIVLEKDNASEIQEKCAENGLLVLTAKKLLRLLPPLNIEYADIDEGLDILERTISESLSETEE